MRRKYSELKRKGNVIVFPTTISRLLTDGMNDIQQEKFADARDKLEEVLSYEPDNAAALGAYAYALYETGEFEEALEVTEALLKTGPVHYIETMELYISLLMQVRRYEEAEQTIEALIEEGVLSEDRIAQFHKLRELNERIHEQVTADKADASRYELESFLAQSPAEQERLVMELPADAYRRLKEEMLRIVEAPGADLLSKTYVLFMLHQAKVDAIVRVEKFHYTGEFSIRKLPDPLKSEKLNAVRSRLHQALEQDPTRLEMVIELFERHVYLLFPFEWNEFSAEEVANTYLAYMEAIFTGAENGGEDPELMELLLRAESWFELRNG